MCTIVFRVEAVVVAIQGGYKGKGAFQINQKGKIFFTTVIFEKSS